MPITISEAALSQRGSITNRAEVELLYNISGATDVVEAYQAVWAYADSTFNLAGVALYRAGIDVEPVGGECWTARVQYTIDGTTVEPDGTPQSPGPEGTMSFRTTGGTQHVTQSLNTRRYSLPGGGSPSFQGAIGVTKDSVDGVDIVVPAFSWSEVAYFDDSFVNNASNPYPLVLRDLTGKVNASTFRDFDAGEVLFLGAEGTRRGIGPWEVSFNFVSQKNQTNLVVGDITVLEKQGWEYMWTRYDDKVSDNRLVKLPIGVYLERVYDSGDFTQLGLS